MNGLLPYEGYLHVLSSIEELMLVASILCLILLQRQTSFAKRAAGDSKWNIWIAVLPDLLKQHRTLFPASPLRKIALAASVAFIGCFLINRDLLRRDQVALQAATASYHQQYAAPLTSNH